MEPTPKQQIIDLIKKSKNVLIFSHENPDGDSIGSSVALMLALKKLNKNVNFICPDPVPENLQFLPGLDQVVDSPKNSDQFTITVDTMGLEVEKLGYKNYPEENKLKIVIKTKSGQIAKENLSFEGVVKPDLIIVLDTSEFERLGRVYEDHATLFYESPVVNIDHHPGNDYFGKVNWIDLTATSTAEIMVSLLESLSSIAQENGLITLIDENIATLLLTGLTTDTGSFQNSNTTPKAFTVAAQLIATGARQQEVVKNIFKTKKITTLKLWGQALTKLKEEQAHRFVWSCLSKEDFALSGAIDSENSGVIDELIKSVPGIDFALLLSEKKNALYGSLRSVNPKTSVEEIAKLFNGGGHKMASAFKIEGGSINQSSNDIIEKIKNYQKQRASKEEQLEESKVESFLPDYV